ncbi:hypothetical protein Tco_0862450 [Tanacetum coccineum]
MSSFRVKEGKFLGHMITEEGLRADPKRIQAIILSPTPRSPNQIQSLFLQLTTISKFIPKLAELKHPIREAWTRMETTKEFGLTNEAEEALRRIKRKLGKLQTLAIPKEGETLMLCLRQRKDTHKVKVVTDGPIEEILKLSRKEERLAKWATEIHTYDISYILRKETEGLVMKKFFSQGEQVERTPDANKGETFTISKKLHEKSTPTPRAWWLYLGKETIKEGLGVGIILVSPEEKMHSYAIRLKFNASNHVMDYEALLAGLAAYTNQGLATIKLEFFNQEVSVGIKTRPSVEEARSSKKGKAASNVPRAEPNYNREASGSN